MYIDSVWKEQGEEKTLHLFHRNHLTPFIDTAVGTHMVGKFCFTALWTAYRVHRRQAVVGPALSLSRFRMPLGWICHDSSLFPLLISGFPFR
jgi:hypothetical protein